MSDPTKDYEKEVEIMRYVQINTKQENIYILS